MKHCKRLNPFNEPSLLFDNLYEISNNESIAEEWYSHFVTDEFLNEFGNYLNINEDNIVEFQGRIDDRNEPLLQYDERTQKYYYLDKYNEPVFYPYSKQNINRVFDNNSIKNFSRTIALRYYENNFDFNTTTFELERINNQDLRSFIKDFIDSKTQELLNSDDFEQSMVGISLNETKNYTEEWYNEVINFYSSLGLNTKLIEVEEQELQEEDIRGEVVRVESFLKSSKANVNSNIKLFLSLLPSNNRNQFNELEYVDFNKIYNILNNNLSGIIPVNNEDEFDLYLDTITNLGNREPSLKILSDRLRNADDNFKNKFVAAFRLNKNSFLTSTVSKDKDGNISYTVQNVAEVGSVQSNIFNEWISNYNLLNPNKEAISKRLDSVFKDLMKNLKNINTEEQLIFYIKRYQDEAKSFGLTFTTEGFNYFLDDLNTETQSIQDRTKKLSKLFQDTLYGLKAKDNIFSNQAVFRTLAKAEAFYKEELSDASIYSIGGNKWVYSLPSFLSVKINQWKKDPQLLLKFYESTPYNRGSHWMKYLTAQDIEPSDRLSESKKRLNEIQLNIFNSFQEEMDSGNGVDGKSISYTDAFSDYINKVLAFKKGDKVYHKTALAADKSTEYQLYLGNNSDYFGISANTTFYEDTGLREVSDDVLEIFYNYFKSEYERMVFEHQYVAQNQNIYNLLPNYHTGNKNAFKSQLFPSLNPGQELPINLYDGNGIPVYEDLDQIKNEVKELIKLSIDNGIKETYDNLFKNEILDFNNEGVKINNGIDKNIYKKYVDEVGNDKASLRIAGDLFINSVISQVEYSKMFTGDVAYYKDVTDYKKRVPETYTDGQYMRLVQGEEFFNIAVIASVEIPVPYLDNLEKLVGKEIASKYQEVNSTDAQAWITPNRWKFIMSRLGKWDSIRESAFNKMMNEDKPSFTNKELKVLGQPLKGVYFDNLNGRPYYLKYSQAVLWPNLIRGTQLEELYNKMSDNSIDELITKDGIKVGYNTPSVVHDEQGNILPSNEFQLNKIQLTNQYWKLQQDLPVKGFKDTDVGSQIQKNIFQGLVYNLNEDFQLDDNTIKGTDFIDHLNSLMSEMSNRGYNKVIKSLGVNPDTLKIEDESKLYNSLIEQLKKRKDTPSNLIKALEAGISPYGIPGAFEMFQNAFSAFVNDNIVKIKTKGGGFIQMADYGLSKTEAKNKGIIFTPWFNTDKLSTPQIEINSETGKKTIIPGGIFISGTLISKYIPDYKKYSSKQLFGTLNEDTGKYEGGIIEQDILTNIIGYRIPNQGLPSNDALTVMGILPDEVGDIIVAYTGITTKTGSDFD